MAYNSMFTFPFMYSVPVLPGSNLPGAYGVNTSRAGLYPDGNTQRTEGGIGSELGKMISSISRGGGDPRQPMANVFYGATSDPTGPKITKMVVSNLALEDDGDNAPTLYKEVVDFNLQWHDGQVLFALDMGRSPWCGITQRMNGGGFMGDEITSVVTVPQLMYLLDGLSIAKALEKDEIGTTIERMSNAGLNTIGSIIDQIKTDIAQLYKLPSESGANTEKGKQAILDSLRKINESTTEFKKTITQYLNEISGMSNEPRESARIKSDVSVISIFDRIKENTSTLSIKISSEVVDNVGGLVNVSKKEIDADFKLANEKFQEFMKSEKIITDKLDEIKEFACGRVERSSRKRSRTLCSKEDGKDIVDCGDIGELYMQKIMGCVRIVGVSCGCEDVDKDRTLIDLACSGIVRCQNYWGDILKPGDRIGFYIAFPEDKVYGRSFIYPWTSRRAPKITTTVDCNEVDKDGNTIKKKCNAPLGYRVDEPNAFFPLGVVITVEQDPSPESMSFQKYTGTTDVWPSGKYLWPLGRYDTVNPKRAANEYKNVRGSLRILLDSSWDIGH